MLDQTDLRAFQVKPINHPKAPTIVRYTWGNISQHALGVSLKSHFSLCHGIAVFLHSLTDQVPKTVYVNYEQSPKASSGILTQDGIHRAFAAQQRQSTFLFQSNSWQSRRYLRAAAKFWTSPNSSGRSSTSPSGPPTLAASTRCSMRIAPPRTASPWAR